MAWVRAARVTETSTTTGTGNITLAGALDSSYRTFASVCSVSDVFKYVIVSSTGAWEEGLGTYNSASVIARTEVSQSTTSNGLVNFTGTLTVFINQSPVAVVAGTTPPITPDYGDIWVDTVKGRHYEWWGTATGWVQPVEASYQPQIDFHGGLASTTVWDYTMHCGSAS